MNAVIEISLLLFLFLALVGWGSAFRVYNSINNTAVGAYFHPGDRGFVGIFGDPSNYGRERINEGAFETPTQELIFEDPKPRQACPGMVGPFSDGSYYCSAREYGYCDRRSGTCFCKTGYAGIDCSECVGSHYRVGNLCYPKKLCEADCSGAGFCHFNNGTCSCLPHRTGPTCATQLCTLFSPLCESCTNAECLSCQGGYYLTGNPSKVCSTCYDFDPRCAGCTKELGCTLCADPILTSVRRSGRREQDPPLPIEENSRELSITIPFGSKSPENFAEAENFFVTTTPSHPLNASTQSCLQGKVALNEKMNDTWYCDPFPASHLVCGHYGVFSFSYPAYAVNETDRFIQLTVKRSGGGHGAVSINYFINHFTTNDSDLAATAFYTTKQKLDFSPGIVENTFLITILDDNIVEGNEVFQVVLETPEGGGSVGPQFRTNVTIIDDDLYLLSPKLSKLAENVTVAVAGEPFSVQLNAAIAWRAEPMNVGGARFFAIIENFQNKWKSPGTPTGSQRHAIRQQCDVVDLHNGKYRIISPGIQEQGNYQLRVWHAFRGGLKGEYYYDAFFQKKALERLDRIIHFSWGVGRIIPRVSEYMSIRWSGVLLAPSTGVHYFYLDSDDMARVWIDSELIVDHWQEQAAFMEKPRQFKLIANKLYEVVIEYLQVTGEAYAHFYWGTSPTELTIIPGDNLFSLYEVDRSPVSVSIHSAATYGPTTECYGDGLYGGTALKTSYFTFCPRDRYANYRDDDDLVYLINDDFHAEIRMLDSDGHLPAINPSRGYEYIAPMVSYNNDSHCFDGQFTPQITGNYRLDIVQGYWRAPKALPVAGSPFIFNVKPSKTFGPFSNVIGLPSPLYLEAGQCFSFSIVSRDAARNLRLVGGDDYEVYMYQVNYYSLFEGFISGSSSNHPSMHPSSSPTSAPSTYSSSFNSTNSTSQVSPPLETPQPVVRYGVVSDHGNGNYTATLCPVIAGWYEIHVLLSAKGVSNQQHRVLDRIRSLFNNLGQGTYTGNYVADSPYPLIVDHSTASSYTTTALGDGVSNNQTVGLPAYFMITVRDAYDNVLRTATHPPTVSVKLDRSPNALTHIWDFHNGSYLIEYTANVTGWNFVSVYVDGMQITNSPFQLFFAEGNTTSHHSYAVGPGLVTGTTGITSYFQVFAYDVDYNRIVTANDIFTFRVSGANNFTGTLLPCPKGDAAHPICDPYDNFLGHYWGSFTPEFAGYILINVYLDSSYEKHKQLYNSPFKATIYPGAARTANSDVWGTLYSNVAGVDAYVSVQLRDQFKNRLIVGGDRLELALLGVAVEWGTILPWGTTPGLPNAYHYRGFYAGYPNYYGLWADHGNGAYTAMYNVPYSGQYVMRLAMAEIGLNATYFNSTSFGYLTDGNFNVPGFNSQLLGAPENPGSSWSWTGDLGRRPDPLGSIGSGTYYERYSSRVESNIDFNLTKTKGSPFNYLSRQSPRDNFREEYWSARWVGMITPDFAENYTFSVVIDSQSTTALYIGGRGNTLNDSDPGQLVLSVNDFSYAVSGTYLFTDTRPREFVMEFQHKSGDALLTLMWQSLTTPLSVVPASAFTHWHNISHYNTTILPAPLCTHCSTAYGTALNEAIVDKVHSFVVYGRDSFGNLLQQGGDKPSMRAVGPGGVSFRGNVVDYGNSTYLISYYPTTSGTFMMYVTIGCCPPHPNVGLPTELEMISPLLIQGAPFLLNINPAVFNSTRSITVGQGIVGGMVAIPLQFVLNYRDIHHNPTFVDKASDVQLDVTFQDLATGNIVIPSSLNIEYSSGLATVNYNLTKAGRYSLYVNSSYKLAPWETILGSPFEVIMSPAKPYANNTVSRGIGLYQAKAGHTFAFELQLFDLYNNRVYVGGNKFYVRLHGDSGFTGPKVVIPTCIDTQNGRYQFSYTAKYSGPHRLIVRLLNSSMTSPGGTGLTASFYSTSDVFGYSAPVVTDITPNIDMSWPNGYLVPRRSDVIDYAIGPVQPTSTIEAQSTGQAVRWEGYLVPPISDTYTFSVIASHANVTVFIDNVQVYDSNPNVYLNSQVSLLANSAYEIYALATVDSAVAGRYPVSVALLWSTARVQTTVIPKFFLFDAGFEIKASPFDVTVT